MKIMTATGIILRRIDYGEADRIITFLTEEYGKILAMAKGVRKQKSKLAGGIEIFSVSELHFIKGRSEIDTLTSTRLVSHFGNIVKDLQRTELAYGMLKNIDEIVENHTGGDYFSVLLESLSALNEPEIDLLLIELSFLMRTLVLQGQLPDFTTDAKGEKLDVSSSYEFDFESVAFLSKTEGKYTKNHIKVLKLLAYNNPKSLVPVNDIVKYCADLKPLIMGIKASL